MFSKHQLGRFIDAAQGTLECDLIFREIHFLDVFTCEWRRSDIALLDGFIVATDLGLKAHQEVDGRKRYLVPGFIDAHVHVESSLLVPANFQAITLPRGTTTAICDPHELANVMGIEGLQYFLREAESLSVDLRTMLSSCVPATHLETNGAGNIGAAELLPLLSHPKALGLAEMMNVPGVLRKDPGVLEKLATFSEVIIDGHCPLLSGRALSAYAATGISSCHESTQLEEAREKLVKGMSVWIREGSVAKDLSALIPLLNIATSTSIGFCTDDRNALDIAKEGHIDYLVRSAIRSGVPSEIVYRSSSWSVARHYQLDRLGAIAPGFRADIVLLDDTQTCAIAQVYKRGIPVDEIPTHKSPAVFKNTVKAKTPEPMDLEGPCGMVHVIGVTIGKILTEHFVKKHDEQGVAKLSVLERYGKGSKPANAYVYGFGKNLRGAIASSVGHDSHNLITVGHDTRDMKVALSALIESGGGFCVVADGNIKSMLPLPIGGLMSNDGPREIEKSLKDLQVASRAIGCEIPEPFLQLAFLSLPVIPKLKLTDRGLVDVEQFKVIDVKA